MFPIDKLRRLRTLMSILYVVSVVCFFVLSRYYIQIAAGLLGFLSILSVYLLDVRICNLQAELRKTKLRLLSRFVPQPNGVIIEDEGPEIDIIAELPRSV